MPDTKIDYLRTLADDLADSGQTETARDIKEAAANIERLARSLSEAVELVTAHAKLYMNEGRITEAAACCDLSTIWGSDIKSARGEL